eukprot:4268841-Amphidinium_carterae.1
MMLCALREVGLKHILIIVNAAGNPYKQPLLTWQQRVECLQLRVRAAVRENILEAGEIQVSQVELSTNWPERERVCAQFETEACSEQPVAVEAVLMLGEDSLLKSLERGAVKHKNVGIYQEKIHMRGMLLFVRDGSPGSVLNKIPLWLKPQVSVAPYQDEVQGLSSSHIRKALQEEAAAALPAESVHPAVWNYLKEYAAAATLRDNFGDVTCSSVEGHLEDGASTAEASLRQPRQHYDKRAKRKESLEERTQSLSVRVRNYNSFAKAVLLERTLNEVRREAG